MGGQSSGAHFPAVSYCLCWVYVEGRAKILNVPIIFAPVASSLFAAAGCLGPCNGMLIDFAAWVLAHSALWYQVLRQRLARHGVSIESTPVPPSPTTTPPTSASQPQAPPSVSALGDRAVSVLPHSVSSSAIAAPAVAATASGPPRTDPRTGIPGIDASATAVAQNPTALPSTLPALSHAPPQQPRTALVKSEEAQLTAATSPTPVSPTLMASSTAPSALLNAPVPGALPMAKAPVAASPTPSAPQPASRTIGGEHGLTLDVVCFSPHTALCGIMRHPPTRTVAGVLSPRLFCERSSRIPQYTKRAYSRTASLTAHISSNGLLVVYTV